MIAVCLLTADRPEYTEYTLRSFAAHNDTSKFALFHADDGSQDRLNYDLARRFGFKTVSASKVRRGGGQALQDMWQYAAKTCDRILHLENDWEWVGPVPDIEAPCVRMYGARKSRSGPREFCDPRNINSGKIVNWVSERPGWRSGFTHWGGPPSITDAKLLLAAADGCERISQIMKRLSLPTWRPDENLVWHIGEERTPVG